MAAAPLRDEHTAATRRRILDAVADLVANEHITAFSVPAVARRAGVSVRTVYRYFPTKEDLLDGLNEYGGPTAQLLEADALQLDDWLEQVPALFGHLDANREVIKSQFRSAAGRETRHRRMDRRRTMMLEALRSELPELDDADRERVATLLMAVGSSVWLYELTDYHGLDAFEAAELSRWAARAIMREAERQNGVPVARPNTGPGTDNGGGHGPA